MPHGAHYGNTCFCGVSESSVDVMNHVVSSVDCISDRGLHSHCLKPRFSNGAVDVAVSSEERHIHAKLIHTYPYLFRRYANKAWDVSTTKEVATNSVLQDHLQGAVYLFVDSVVVSCPVRTELLGSEEERTGKNEGSECRFVTSY